MSLSLFSQIAAELVANKTVDKMIVGQPYLGEGVHNVTITSVDLADAATNRIGFALADDNGHAFNDKTFLTSTNQKTDAQEISYSVRMILSGVLPGSANLKAFLDACGANPEFAFGALTGMKLQVKLVPGKGVQARTVPGQEGFYAGYDVESGDKMTEDHTSIAEVYNEVKARALKRSYLKIGSCAHTHREDNEAAFAKALAAKPAQVPAKKAAKSF